MKTITGWSIGMKLVCRSPPNENQQNGGRTSSWYDDIFKGFVCIFVSNELLTLPIKTWPILLFYSPQSQAYWFIKWTYFLQYKAKRAQLRVYLQKWSHCPLTVPESPLFFFFFRIVSASKGFNSKCHTEKQKWHRHDIWDYSWSHAQHVPDITLCHFRACMPAGVTILVQPSRDT